jgi:uncharacterized RDD family membrane protein YckC
MESETAERPSVQVASLPRRLGAMLYDGVLLLGLVMLAITLLIVPYDLLAARPYPHQDILCRTLMQLYLVAVVAGFYVYFWTHGGQTLGMRTWRLRAVRDDGSPLNRADALRRLGWATLSLLPAGLGLWWSLFDRERLAWHDRQSRTRLVIVPLAKSRR